MPTGLAAGGNEIISAPEFQQNAFSESGYFRKSRWAGNYEVFVAGKGYVTRYGDKLICSNQQTTTGLISAESIGRSVYVRR